MSDMELLRLYVQRDSEEAFATLVARYVNLLYSAALRKTGNAAAAEEITQAVFIILAKKSPTLPAGVILSGWLYQTTRLTASSYLRGEIRRARREQEAYMQSLTHETETETWSRITPLLEDALGQLNEKDRNAIVLRFFEGKSFAEIGAAFGATENAAKKRVGYTVEKLRKYFSRQGVVVPAAVLMAAISANSVKAAPVALAKSATAAALAKGASASTSTLTLSKGALKIMAWTKIKTTVVVGVSVLLATGGGVGLYALQKHYHFGADYYPSSTWKASGYATPEATLKSLLGAKAAGDPEAFLATDTPEVAQQVEAFLLQGKSAKERSARIKLSIKKFTGIEIQKKTVLPDGRITFHLQFDNEPKTNYTIITFTNLNTEWKIESSEDCYNGVISRVGSGGAEVVPENQYHPRLSEVDFTPRADSALQGVWTGAANSGSKTLFHAEIKIAESNKDTFLADFYVTEQGHTRQLAEVSHHGKTVIIKALPNAGWFEGELSDDGKKIIGHWIQNGQLAMTLTRAN